MKTDNIIKGQQLTLKTVRMAAYGLQSPIVTVSHVQVKQGYATPWIVAIDYKGQLGHYKPSDFTGNQREPAKATGRKYSSVAELMRGEGVSQEVQDMVKQLEEQ